MRQPILPFIIIAVFAASLSLSFFLGRHYEQSERYGYGSHDTDAAKAQSQSEQAWDDDGKNSIRDGRSLSANGLDRWSRAVIADVKKKAVEIQTERRPTSSSSSSSSLPSSSTPQAPHQSKSADLTVIELPSLTDMASIGNLHVDVWKKECTKEPRFHIYGLMITGKDFFHYELAKRSVASFFNQTYSSKQLVVVNDSPEYSLAGLHPCLTEIRVVRKPTESFSLGTLRNVGINAVPTGSYWIQWDDDDWHSPECITLQMQQLLDKKVDVVMLTRQYRTILAANSSYIYTVHDGIQGTVLVHKTSRLAGTQYPPMEKREDSVYRNRLIQAGAKLEIWKNPAWVYFRLFHGANTWSSAHFRVTKTRDNKWCQALKYAARECTSDETTLHKHVFEVYKDFTTPHNY